MYNYQNIYIIHFYVISLMKMDIILIVHMAIMIVNIV